MIATCLLLPSALLLPTAQAAVSAPGPTLSLTPTSPYYFADTSFEVHLHANDTVEMTTGNASHDVNGVLVEHFELYGMNEMTSWGYYQLLYPSGPRDVYSFTVNNSAGGSSTIALEVVIDTDKPTIQILTPAGGSYNNTRNVLLSWHGEDATSGIDRYEIFVDGSGPTVVGADVTSYILTHLGDGHKTVEVWAYDKAGNSAKASVHFIEDATGPLVEITSPSGSSILNTSDVQVAWQGANPLSGISHYELSLDGGETQTVAASTHEHTFEQLAEGSHTVVVKAVDNAGNNDTDTVTFSVDTVHPTITTKTPTGNEIPMNTSIRVTFSEEMDEDETTVSVSGVNGTVTWNDNTIVFTPASTFNGSTEYDITVSGKDRAGNAVSEAWSFTTAASSAGSTSDLDITWLILALILIAIVLVVVYMARRRKR